MVNITKLIVFKCVYMYIIWWCCNKMITGTTVVFVSFSISALLAERGRWLYLGGTLMSMLNIMILFSFANLFLRSTFIYQAHLYLGLFVICGFVIYDTQLIIEKHHMGSRDFIMHSLDLFIDFVGIFRHLLVILTQKVNCFDKLMILVWNFFIGIS